MNGSEERVEDHDLEERLQSQARRIYVEATVAAAVLTLLGFLLPR